MLTDGSISTRMLIRVLHGASETLLCNTQCAVVNLVSYIRRQSGLSHSARIDLAHQQTGLVIGLDGVSPTENASEIIGNLQSCFLVERKEKNVQEDETFPFYYEPLLRNFHSLYPNIDVIGTSAMLQLRPAQRVATPEKTKKVSKKSPGRKPSSNSKITVSATTITSSSNSSATSLTENSNK